MEKNILKINKFIQYNDIRRPRTAQAIIIKASNLTPDLKIICSNLAYSAAAIKMQMSKNKQTTNFVCFLRLFPSSARAIHIICF